MSNERLASARGSVDCPALSGGRHRLRAGPGCLAVPRCRAVAPAGLDQHDAARTPSQFYGHQVSGALSARARRARLLLAHLFTHLEVALAGSRSARARQCLLPRPGVTADRIHRSARRCASPARLAVPHGTRSGTVQRGGLAGHLTPRGWFGDYLLLWAWPAGPIRYREGDP